MSGRNPTGIAIIVLLATTMFYKQVSGMGGGLKGISGAAIIAALLGGGGHHSGHKFLPIPIPIPIHSGGGGSHHHHHDDVQVIPFFGGHHAHDYGHIDHGHVMDHGHHGYHGW